MKFKKKSKPIMVITTICTVAVCFCFLATGAYAAPSNNNEAGQFISDAVSNVENNKYTYIQRTYYSDSYIIEMGWNLNNAMCKEYANSKEITLEDNSTILVYFGGLPFGDINGNAIDYLNDSNAISAIGKLVYSLKNTDMQNYPTLEIPLVTNITYVGEDLLTLAEEYFESDNAAGFLAIFNVLDRELQQEYYQKIYDSDKISFFAAAIPYMDKDSMMLYADKAEQDGKTNFFSVILYYMPSDAINRYANKYYEADNVSRFANITFYMTTSEKQEWLAKAKTDKKDAFVAVLSPNGPWDIFSTIKLE